MTLNPEQLVALGRIGRTQGHLGAVRLVPYFAPLEQFAELRSPELILFPPEALGSSPGKFQRVSESSFKILHVREFRFHQDFVVLHFEEIPDMNAAEPLRGMEVYVREENLWPLPQDQFFPHELLGFHVLDANEGTPLGVVSDVRTGGPADYLLVEREGRKFLIPLVRDIVQGIDPSARQIRVVLPPGLDEL